MDDNKLNKYYGEIAEKIDEMMPVEWDNLILYAEVTSDTGAADFYFNEKDSEEYYLSNSIPTRYNVSREIYRQLWNELININRNLWLEFKNSEHEMWYAFVFYLDSSWKFRIKYLYEKNDQIDNVERRIRWAYDELGIIPEGDFDRELLNEYLEQQGKSL